MLISSAVLSGALWLFSSCAPSAPPAILSGIAMQESGFDETAIDDDTERTSYFPKNIQKAQELAVALIAKHHDIDVGILGINFNGFTRNNVPITAAFDQCASAHLSSEILMGNYAYALSRGYRGRDAWIVALSRYNTGTYPSAIGTHYANDVLANAQKMLPEILALQNGIYPPVALSPIPLTYATQATHAITPINTYAQALELAKERQKRAQKRAQQAYASILHSIQEKQAKAKPKKKKP